MFFRRSKKKKSVKSNIKEKAEVNVLGKNDVKPVAVESAVINENKHGKEEVKATYETDVENEIQQTDLIESAVENEIEHSGKELKKVSVSFQAENNLLDRVKILNDAIGGFNIELIINDSHEEFENCVSEEGNDVQIYEQEIDNEEYLSDAYQISNQFCGFTEDYTVSVNSDRYRIALEESRDANNDTSSMIQHDKIASDLQNVPVQYRQEKRDNVASGLQKEVLLKDVQEKRMATEILQLQNDKIARELENEVLKKDLEEKRIVKEMLQLQNNQVAKDLEKEVLKKDLQEKRLVTEMLQLQNDKITRELQNEVLFKSLQEKRMATELLQEEIDAKITKLQKGIGKKEKEIKGLKLEIGTIDENLVVLKEFEEFKGNAKELKESKKELSKKLKKLKKHELVDECMISNLEEKCALVDEQLAEAKSECKIIKKKYDIDEENIKEDRKSLKHDKKDLKSRVRELEDKNEGMRKQLEKELVSKKSVSRLLHKIKNVPISSSVLEYEEDDELESGHDSKKSLDLDTLKNHLAEFDKMSDESKKSLDSDTLKNHLAEFDKMSDELSITIDVNKESKNEGNRKHRKRSKKSKSSKSKSKA